MRFVHISDTHISADPGFSNYGHEPLSNLDALVDAINRLSFKIDFVLHTGDVVEDRSEAAYRAARRALGKLRRPVLYLAGNHDDGDALQAVMLGETRVKDRFDWERMAGGVRLVALDTRGPDDPQGTLTDGQLSWLRGFCAADGPPMAIFMHHPPLPMDTPWLDNGWAGPKRHHPHMLLNRGPEFLDVLAPARDRIRGVFFGHIHRSCQIAHRGILFCGAPSAFGQLHTWPDQTIPEASADEPGGFTLVTVTAEQTIVRQHAIKRPAPHP
jgi:3',5'-cyclic AMP phosphodiesterase CpdA